MAYTFNTGNPVGANGSTDARDLVDNAQVADRLITGTDLVVPDRLGVMRRTWNGIQQSVVNYVNRGEWVTATAYNVNDIWRDGPSGAFYLVLADYTSGASAAADIAGVNVVVHQPKDWVSTVTSVADAAALTGMAAGQSVNLVDGGRSGLFDVVSGNFTTQVAADTLNGIHIAMADDPTGATKVLKRRLNGYVTPEMFGAVGDGVTNDAQAIQAAIDFVKGGSDGLVSFGGGKEYAISETTTKVLSFTGATHNVCIYIDDSVNINFNGAVLVPTLTDSNIKNAIYIDNASNVNIFDPVIKPNNSVTVRKLYRHTSIVITGSSSVRIVNPISIGSPGNTLAFNSENIDISGGQALNESNISGMHFGLIGCSDSSIRHCTTYQGTQDGDIGLFGIGENNTVESCRVYNFPITDTTRTPTSTGAQGIFVDSGMNKCSIVNCHSEGFYYGIDVKTNVNGTLVKGNRVVSCKHGIAVRYGEGDAPVANTLIMGNVIFPNNGNGSSSVVTDTYTETGVYIQNSLGTVVIDNVFGSDFTSPVSITGFIGVYLTWNTSQTQAYSSPTKISNNHFQFETRIGTSGAINRAPAIIAKGSSSYEMKNLTISNNDFDVEYGGSGGTVPVLSLQYIKSASVTLNTFTEYRYGVLIDLDDSDDISISSNMIDRHYGVLNAKSVNGLSFNGNTMNQGLAGVSVPTLNLDTVTRIVCNDNNYRKDASSFTDGEFLTGVSSDYLIMCGNFLDIQNKGPSNYYSIDGVNTVVANNLVL